MYLLETMAKKVTIDIINDEFLWQTFVNIQAIFEQTSRRYEDAIAEERDWLGEAGSAPTGYVRGPGLGLYKDANVKLITALELEIKLINKQLAKVTKDRYWKAPKE